MEEPSWLLGNADCGLTAGVEEASPFTKSTNAALDKAGTVRPSRGLKSTTLVKPAGVDTVGRQGSSRRRVCTTAGWGGGGEASSARRSCRFFISRTQPCWPIDSSLTPASTSGPATILGRSKLCSCVRSSRTAPQLGGAPVKPNKGPTERSNDWEPPSSAYVNIFHNYHIIQGQTSPKKSFS